MLRRDPDFGTGLALKAMEFQSPGIWNEDKRHLRNQYTSVLWTSLASSRSFMRRVNAARISSSVFLQHCSLFNISSAHGAYREPCQAFTFLELFGFRCSPCILIALSNYERNSPRLPCCYSFDCDKQVDKLSLARKIQSFSCTLNSNECIVSFRGGENSLFRGSGGWWGWWWDGCSDHGWWGSSSWSLFKRCRLLRRCRSLLRLCLYIWCFNFNNLQISLVSKKYGDNNLADVFIWISDGYSC